MRKFLKMILAAIGCLCAWMPSEASDNKLVDYGPAPQLIEVQVEALGGGSTIMQNYKKTFPNIQNQNINMGTSWGVGAKAVFGIRNFLGIGTAFNVMLNHYNVDMAIVSSGNTSMSALFINSHNYTVNIPVFVSFRFNVAHSVRWNVDGGMYYSYGFAGRQKQLIYRAELNAMDELVPELEQVTTDYYHSPRTLFNVFNRGDIGLHLGSSLDFGPHLTVGFQTQLGLKNQARSNGVYKPSTHNISLHGLVGYRF
ncbi:MAG: PorT family protein [Firmicutes bacterium]|nr:PorT family protein [Bacillota bacterium]MCM1401962.1 PorT family protein [Bacteroides sp.]MCM1477808.1 PorT family protein [Bacteroides sp.]